MAKRLEAARAAIEPQIGASTHTVNSQAIETQSGGANNPLNQVLLQAPGVSQDAESAGGIIFATRCHHRMPVILPATARRLWLGEEKAEPTNRLASSDHPVELMRAYPVGVRVTNPRKKMIPNY